MRTLDHRLYAWLAEPDDWRFERAFNTYFSAAFPAVVRHLARHSQWDSVRLEDLAQEALLKFFDRAGRGRREASQTVGSALVRLRSLDLSPFNKPQVDGWIHDVSTFANAATSLIVIPVSESAASHWKDAIRALADRIPSLQSRGRSLLDAVRPSLHWTIQDQTPCDAPPDPGVTSFCENVLAITAALPRLRVPTNSYLFQIARSIYLDECKKDGRHKRGGTITQRLDQGDAADDPSDEPTPAAEPVTCSASPGPPADDPTQQYESEEFFNRFFESLRWPVDRAAAAYQRARLTGHAASERRRLESLTRKLSRTLSVLSWTGAGYTQDQIAAKLGLSRNQVKYILEAVQQAYTQFRKPHVP